MSLIQCRRPTRPLAPSALSLPAVLSATLPSAPFLSAPSLSPELQPAELQGVAREGQA